MPKSSRSVAAIAPNARLQLATAYVDQIPARGGVAAIVSKGTFARRSLDQLDHIVAADPQWWTPLFARATNHLHWPRALRHSEDAAADFRRLLELQSAGPSRSYHARTWVGLGDALAKAGDPEGARAAWSAGLAAHPDEAGFEQHLSLESAEEALAYVLEARSLEQAIDTDLSFVLQP